MLLVNTSNKHWLRLCFKPLCIQFLRFATLYSYLALYCYYICAICHPILLFGTICLLGTQEYPVDNDVYLVSAGMAKVVLLFIKGNDKSSSCGHLPLWEI